MGVTHVPGIGQRGGVEWNDLPSGSLSALDDVSPMADQYWVLEEVVRRAVLLENHHNVMNQTATGSADAVEAREDAPRGQHHDCEYLRYEACSWQSPWRAGGRYLPGISFLTARTACHCPPHPCSCQWTLKLRRRLLPLHRHLLLRPVRKEQKVAFARLGHAYCPHLPTASTELVRLTWVLVWKPQMFDLD
jgi:hypothetical protein